MNIQITKYSSKDIDSIDTLFHQLQLHENKYDKDKATEFENAKLYRKEIIKSVKKQSGEILVAKVDNKVVGLISWYIEKEVEYSIPYAYISDIVVNIEMRNKGIGRKLMSKCIEDIKKKGLKRIYIGVLLANKGAKKLYNNLGFTDYSIEMVKRMK